MGARCSRYLFRRAPSCNRPTLPQHSVQESGGSFQLPSEAHGLDTNILIYATLISDPTHSKATSLLAARSAPGNEYFVSVQNLAEMYPNLTVKDFTGIPGIAAVNPFA